MAICSGWHRLVKSFGWSADNSLERTTGLRPFAAQFMIRSAAPEGGQGPQNGQMVLAISNKLSSTL
jgi:hypothetical protein